MVRMIFLVAISLRLGRAEMSAEDRLYKAVAQGDMQTLEMLLSSGVNPDLKDRYGQTPLYLAAVFNENKAAERLLALHADPNALVAGRIDNGQFPATPLQCAATAGNLHIASILLAAGARVNATGENGRTALHLAAFFGRLDMLKFLIDKGAELNVRDARGMTPLDDATRRGYLDAAAILLAHGARLNEPEAQTGATPINQAAYRGNAALVRYFLQFHPDLRIADRKGFGPLENAVRSGKEDSALVLLEADAAGRDRPSIPESLTESAIRKDEVQVVQVLLRRGLSAGGALPSGNTPLGIAASAGALRVAQLLLENGADADAVDGHAASPLEDAALHGFDSVATVLLEHGATVDQVNAASGTTALYAAASFGKLDVLRVLLDHGANPSLCGKNRKSPYAAAVENGYSEVAAELQTRGAVNVCSH